MNFDIKTEPIGGDAYVIALTGEVDLYTAPEFKQRLLDVIGKGAKNVFCWKPSLREAPKA